MVKGFKTGHIFPWNESYEGKFYAKGDQEQAMTDVQKSRTTQGQGYTDYLANAKEQRQPPDQARHERDQIWTGASDYAATGGTNADQNARIRQAGLLGPAPNVGGSGGGGGGGLSNYGNPPGSQFNYVGPSAFTNNSAIDNPIASLADTNASRYGDVRGQIGKLNDFAATGGLTADDYKALNRDNFYEFEKTGGYSDPQLADIRARSNSTAPAFYQNLQDQMALNRTRTGQYGGAQFDAASASAARQGAQQSADQARNTEIDLANAVRQGRMSASQQLAANELGVIQYTTPAKEAALASAAQNSNQLASTINQGLYSSGQLALAKAKGIDDYTINVASGKDAYATKEDQIAAQRAMASAGINAQLSIAQAQLNSQNERFIASQYQQGQQFGMGQLADIYRSSNGQQSADNRDWLAGLNGYAGSQNQNLGIEANLSNNKGGAAQGFSNLFSGMGSIAPLLNGFGGSPATGGPGGSGGGDVPGNTFPNGIPDDGSYYPGAPGYPGDGTSGPNNPLPGGVGGTDPTNPDGGFPQDPGGSSSPNHPESYLPYNPNPQLGYSPSINYRNQNPRSIWA